MKNLFLSFALLLAAMPATAQDIPLAAQPNSQAEVSTVPDTVAAIHRLFAAQRKRRNIIAFITAGAAVGGITVVLAGPTGFFNKEGYVKAYGILAAGIIGLDFLASDSGRKYEQELVDAFQAHQLPDAIRSKLKPKYFR